MNFKKLIILAFALLFAIPPGLATNGANLQQEYLSEMDKTLQSLNYERLRFRLDNSYTWQDIGQAIQYIGMAGIGVAASIELAALEGAMVGTGTTLSSTLFDFFFPESGSDRRKRHMTEVTNRWLENIISSQFHRASIDKKLSPKDKENILISFRKKLREAEMGWKSLGYNDATRVLVSQLLEIRAKQTLSCDCEKMGELQDQIQLRPSKPKKATRKERRDHRFNKLSPAEFYLLADGERARLRFQVMSLEEQNELLEQADNAVNESSYTAINPTEKMFVYSQASQFIYNLGVLTNNKGLAEFGFYAMTATSIGLQTLQANSYQALIVVNGVLAAAVAIHQMKQAEQQQQMYKALFTELRSIKEMINQLSEQMANHALALADQLSGVHQDLSLRLQGLSVQISRVHEDVVGIQLSVDEIRKLLLEQKKELRHLMVSLAEMQKDQRLSECFNHKDEVRHSSLSPQVVQSCVESLILFATKYASGTHSKLQSNHKLSGVSVHDQHYPELIQYLKRLGRVDINWMNDFNDLKIFDLNVVNPSVWSHNVDKLFELMNAYKHYPQIWSEKNLQPLIATGRGIVGFHQNIWDDSKYFLAKTEDTTKNKPYRNFNIDSENKVIAKAIDSLLQPYNAIAQRIVAKNKEDNKNYNFNGQEHYLWNNTLGLPLIHDFFTNNKATVNAHRIKNASIQKCEDLPGLRLKTFGIKPNSFKINRYTSTDNTAPQIATIDPHLKKWYKQSIDKKKDLDKAFMRGVTPNHLKINLPGSRSKTSNFNAYIPRKFRWLEFFNSHLPANPGTAAGEIVVCYSNFNITRLHRTYKNGTYKGKLKTNWLNWTNTIDLAIHFNFFIKTTEGRAANTKKIIYRPFQELRFTQKIRFSDEKPLNGDGVGLYGYKWNGMIKDLILNKRFPGRGITMNNYSPLSELLTMSHTARKKMWGKKAIPINPSQLADTNRYVDEALKNLLKRYRENTIASYSKDGQIKYHLNEVVVNNQNIDRLMDIMALQLNLKKEKLDDLLQSKKELLPEVVFKNISEVGLKKALGILDTSAYSYSSDFNSFVVKKEGLKPPKGQIEIQLNALEKIIGLQNLTKKL